MLKFLKMCPLKVILVFGAVLHTTSIGGSFLQQTFDKISKENIWLQFLSEHVFPDKRLDSCMINFYISSSSEHVEISAMKQYTSQTKFRYISTISYNVKLNTIIAG